MRILLVNPSSSPYPFRKEPELTTEISNYAPLAILTVAQYYREQGHHVEVMDSRSYWAKDVVPEMEKKLEGMDALGLSVNTYTIHESIILSKHAKSLGKKVIWGGVHPRLYPEQCLELADNVVTKDLQPKSIIPAYDLIPFHHYTHRIHKNGLEYQVLDLQLTRGCPYRCAFCINPLLHNKFYSMPPVSKIVKAINEFAETYMLTHINFLDENFFVNQGYTRKIIEALPEGVTFTADCRANYFKTFDDNMKELLKEKFIMLSIGAESGSQRVLDYIRKDITLDDIRLANRVCKNAGVIPNFSFMAGIPTETIEEMKQTMGFILELKRNNKNMYYTPQQPFRPYPGCELYNDLKDHGMIDEPDNLEGWIQFAYEDSMPWLDGKTHEFMKSLIYWSAKARGSGTRKSGVMKKAANLKLRSMI